MTLRRALIGHTGFVGGNLARQAEFHGLFNSTNVESIADAAFDLIVCAGAPAVKWLANREPEADRAALERLAAAVSAARCDELVLISTIDVYPAVHDADESFDCRSAPNHAYGRHRLWLEERMQARFPRCTVVRLPALFGPGLKKNVIFDLLHQNCVDIIQPRSSFQWYGIDRLWADVELARRANLPLVNLFTEPLGTQAILDRCFRGAVVGERAGPEAHYDLRTRNAEVFGGHGSYIEDAESVLEGIARYVASARAGLPA